MPKFESPAIERREETPETKPPDVLAQIEQNLATGETSPAFQRRCLEIASESKEILATLSSKRNEHKETEDLSLAAASMVAGLQELRRELDHEHSSEIEGGDMDAAILQGLLCKLEIDLKAHIPPLVMDVTPAEGIEAIQRTWQEGRSSGAYARVATVLGKKVQAKVEGLARDALEYCSGIIPEGIAQRITDRASKLPGRSRSALPRSVLDSWQSVVAKECRRREPNMRLHRTKGLIFLLSRTLNIMGSLLLISRLRPRRAIWQLPDLRARCM
jgi:hypothetical protein